MVIITSTNQMEPISLPSTVRLDTLLEMVLVMRMTWTTGRRYKILSFQKVK